MPGKNQLQATILIIDDDIAIRTSLGLLLKQAGYASKSASGPQEALSLLGQHTFDLAILDMNFSVEITGDEGLDLLARLKRAAPALPVILITAWGSVDLAVKGMKTGAADFITKPWNNDHLVKSVQTALRLTRNPAPVTDASPSRKELDQHYNFEKLAGEDPSFLKALVTAGRVSDSDAPVLILGESGTGKELVAEAIHQNSQRRDRPFVKVNLGGISSTLFESEMFGHKRGAFTDAKYDRTGRFESAHTGTIFLDEIADLDLGNQVKLLRVLQDRSFEALGSSKTKTVDFRVICATNRDVDKLVAERRFREDLFYRINLITVVLPPLRERMNDIPLLVNHFIENLKTIYRRPAFQITPRAMQWLMDLPWPGNIRELKNLVERVFLMSEKDTLDHEDFAVHLQPGIRTVRGSQLPAVGTMTLEEMERSMISRAFEYHNRNISQVARSLGLSRAALYRRMEKYGISE